MFTDFLKFEKKLSFLLQLRQVCLPQDSNKGNPSIWLMVGGVGEGGGLHTKFRFLTKMLSPVLGFIASLVLYY